MAWSRSICCLFSPVMHVANGDGGSGSGQISGDLGQLPRLRSLHRHEDRQGPARIRKPVCHPPRLALAHAGVSFNNFAGARCPASTRASGLAASAQGLAEWLTRRPFAGCPAPESYDGKTVFEKIKDRTGIIFLANYWQRSGETGNARSGDHIDLWNGSRMTAVSSWFRVHIGISWDGLWSDFRGAPKTLFWNIL